MAALHLQPLAVEEQALHPLPGYPLCRVALPPDEAVPARLATQTLDRPRSNSRNPFWIQTPWSAPQNRYVLLKMKDGKTISGKLLSVDTFAYQIFDSTEKLANISKENVREMTMASPMPSYRDKLTTQELSDVISYLISLKGQ